MARPARARGCAPGVGARARAMPAPSDSSVRRLLCLGVLPLLLRRASAQCSSIVEPVTALEGAISAPDVLRDGTCAWMLMARGHNQYESLKLTNNGVRLIGSSRLLLCSPQIVYNINGEGHVQCHQPEVALYSALSPMPSEISITHVDHVMIVFPTDPENGTAVHISFEWVEAGFTMTFWPIAIVIGISLLGTCVSAALLYLMCFIRGRIRNRNSASGTLVAPRWPRRSGSRRRSDAPWRRWGPCPPARGRRKCRATKTMPSAACVWRPTSQTSRSAPCHASTFSTRTASTTGSRHASSRCAPARCASATRSRTSTATRRSRGSPRSRRRPWKDRRPRPWPWPTSPTTRTSHRRPKSGDTWSSRSEADSRMLALCAPVSALCVCLCLSHSLSLSFYVSVFSLSRSSRSAHSGCLYRQVMFHFRCNPTSDVEHHVRTLCSMSFDACITSASLSAT
ncbi:unnamed protein product [Prorocentrum cordatum]|uniref:Uncharacterized protein n=1 Tax=Prorocentrum cordatum TaxID=2364126 RepID=A0ABN9SV78_9DINO|nr:unnamed protein product [Polarella glacialis]